MARPLKNRTDEVHIINNSLKVDREWVEKYLIPLKHSKGEATFYVIKRLYEFYARFLKEEDNDK